MQNTEYTGDGRAKGWCWGMRCHPPWIVRNPIARSQRFRYLLVTAHRGICLQRRAKARPSTRRHVPTIAQTTRPKISRRLHRRSRDRIAMLKGSVFLRSHPRAKVGISVDSGSLKGRYFCISADGGRRTFGAFRYALNLRSTLRIFTTGITFFVEFCARVRLA